MPSCTPPQILYSYDGMLMGRVCTPEAGCVVAPVRLCVRVFTDDTWHIAYYDPEDPMNCAPASGVEPCEAQALGRMLTAISSVALTPAHPVKP